MVTNDRFDLSPPRGGIALMAGCFLFASTFFLIDGGDTWVTRWVCPAFLPVAIGLWLKHSWARWVIFSFFLLVAVLIPVALIIRGFTWGLLVSGLVVAGSLHSLWEWKVYPEDDD